MNQRSWTLTLIVLILALAIVGCGNRAPAPTPTRVATSASQVITVVVTPTEPPAPPTLTEATITPLPTIEVATAVPLSPPTATVAPTATVRKPTVAPKPTVVVATATATTLPLVYPAPKLIGPVLDPNGRKDQVVVGSAMVFEWQSVGNLGENECALVRVKFDPGAGDAFMDCDPAATQVPAGKTAKFTLQRPGYNGVNYSGLLAPDTGQTNVTWSVQVVRDMGPAASGAYFVPDASRHAFAPLSPASAPFQFPLFGNK